jgi:enoyl-CoA hydratase/carnithine racemase
MSEVERFVDDGVLTITLSREARKNALTRDMYVDLESFLVQADSEDAVRSVVIRGSNGVFTAGNDLDDFLVNPPHEPDAPVWRFLLALSRLTKPVVAAVCGSAIGIGTTMLLHADIVVAADDARFALPFVNLGVCPEAASSLLLPRLMGYQRACELLLLGEVLDAHRAGQYGLVNCVVPGHEVFSVADSIARRLARQPIAALRATRSLLRSTEQDAIKVRMAEEVQVFSGLLGTPEAQAAIAGFVQKTKSRN